MQEGLAERVAANVRASAGGLLEHAARMLPAIVTAITVLLVAWGVATIVRRVALSAARYIENPTQRNLIRQLSFYPVWAIGIVVALDVLGLNAQAIVTGLGLGGLALGFALKDIISNLVSGLLILFMHTFDIGDEIVVGETEGTVERIEVRVTHIRTYDGRLVLVPNGEVFTSRVTNNTASPLRRASVMVYLEYREDLERAMCIILETMTRVPGVAAHPTAAIQLRDLTPQQMLIEAKFWTDSRRADFTNTLSAARIAIVYALAREGVALPNPDQRQVTLVHNLSPAVPSRDPASQSSR